MFDLSGKEVMVTGGDQHVGEGILRALAAQGAKIVVSDYYAERAEAAIPVLLCTGRWKRAARY